MNGGFGWISMLTMTGPICRRCCARAEQGDKERARPSADRIATKACKTARNSGAADYWLNLTLLGLALDDADVEPAAQCFTNIRRKVYPAWMLETTLKDLKPRLDQVRDAALGNELRKILAQMENAMEVEKS
jgi:hypothetical protein